MNTKGEEANSLDKLETMNEKPERGLRPDGGGDGSRSAVGLLAGSTIAAVDQYEHHETWLTIIACPRQQAIKYQYPVSSFQLPKCRLPIMVAWPTS